ncbi:MAG: M48 family metallopeptidase [Burkholderiales bacterium]|nr:M48 family metallopeptidase [Burkholderiales bacterium]
MHVSPTLLALTFAGLLTATTFLRLWLATRQIRHVARHRAQVPTAYATTIAVTAHQKAADYTVAKTRLSVIDIGLQATLLLGWTLLGGLDALNKTLLEWMPLGLLQQVALVISFMLLGSLLELPMSWYQTFKLEEQFGFNRTTRRAWILDGLKGAAVGAVIGIPILATVLWLMASAGNIWWLWAWGVFMGFNLLLMVIYPTVIAPLFNTFKPLDDDALATRVNALMTRCGFRAKGFFVMDGSRRSAHANAYFTGFGSAKRVVFYDTLLNQLSAPEVEAVLAHELGHFHHKHIVKRVVLMALTSLAGLAALGWLSGQAWFYVGLGVEPNLQGGNEALALLLFMMATPLATFFLSPLAAASSRRHEFQADAFAASHANASDLVAALLKLYRDNAATLTPDPWYVWFYYSHPPAADRLGKLNTFGGAA